MSSVAGICFDLFHTLVDVGKVPSSAGRSTADILGLDSQAWNAACMGALHDICRPTAHVDSVRQLAHSLDPGIPLELIEEAAAARQRRFDLALLDVEAQVLDALAALRARGLRLALVSNASTGEVCAWPRSPLAPLFDAAVFSCECGSRKPEPAIYHTALQRLGLSAEQCLFVGDGGSDEHAGARGVGLRPVLITQHIRSRCSAAELQQRMGQADWVVDSIEALVERLDG